MAVDVTPLRSTLCSVPIQNLELVYICVTRSCPHTGHQPMQDVSDHLGLTRSLLGGPRGTS
eukprot:9488090-Pyramimonas_sp.AAC.1